MLRHRSDALAISPARAAGNLTDYRLVQDDGVTLVRFERLTAEALAASSFDPRWSVRLSPFSFLHVEDGTFVLETALSDVRVALTDPRSVTMIVRLATPASARVLAEVGGCPPAVIAEFVHLLVRSRLAEVVDSSSPHEEANRPYAAWEFHDLLFHRRSRSSPSVRQSGRRDICSPSVTTGQIRSAAEAAQVPLWRPDESSSVFTDVPLAWALEHRRSVRIFDGEPLSARTLGEFLFRTAHSGREEDHARAAAHRPYPSGGACYPLEIYPVVVRCVGLSAGLYRYDPEGHSLRLLSPVTEVVEQLIAGAMPDPSAPSLPSVVFILTARFHRMQSTYEAIAYSLVLKEVGALIETMYLVATGMGLGGCAIGWGDAELFARVSGAPPLQEGSVGEFVIGTYDRRAERA